MVLLYCSFYWEQQKGKIRYGVPLVKSPISCSHNDCKRSENSQMNNTTVVQVGDRKEKGGRLGEWCSWVKSLWVSVVITDISSGFSVFENHSKSRLQPDGHPCNHSSNSICSVIERQCSLSACLLKEWHTAWILTSHWRTEIVTVGINVGHWKRNLAGLHAI